MKEERHAIERQRLQLERLRDVLFEAKVILAELARDNSVSGTARRNLEREIDSLEATMPAASIEDAFHLRDRAREYYAPRNS